MERPELYIPIDRRLALARGASLPERAHGAALFADISGFTPLTEALVQALGAQRGAEELPRQLNLIYDALVAEVHRYGGTVIGFSGDAITCWFDENNERETMNDRGRMTDSRWSFVIHRSSFRAVACALAMQSAMARFASVAIPGAGVVALAIKVAVASGVVRRFAAGDPAIQLVDVLAGQPLERLAEAEHLAAKGEVVLDADTAAQLGARLIVAHWRVDAQSGRRYAVARRLEGEVPTAPWPDPPPGAWSDAQLRPWLLPPVYERLRSGRGEFLTELRPAVALFLRFGGIDFDADADAGAKIDLFLRWVQEVLASYGGFMLQMTIGDKGCYLYGAFGAPVAHEDDAARAVAAALELRMPPPSLGFVQDVQIGLSQGRMRTGAYGAFSRRTYGVLGDDVNLAARLMQASAPGQVLAARPVQKLVAGQFIWEALPPMRLKGKARPTTVFRLIERKTRRPARLQEPRYMLPMVGRAAELALVEQLFGQAIRGQGQIVAVTAEAGMGKSRLVDEIIRLALARGMAAYVGECQSYGARDSYLVWENIWRAFFDIDPTAALDEQVRALRRQLRAVDRSLVSRLPLLGVALNLPLPDNALTRSLDAKLRKASLEALLIDCVRARAMSTPLLLVLEDCHWIDSLSHDLAEALGRIVADLPVLMVVAYRPPELERIQAPRVTLLPNCTVIDLVDFSPHEARQLIELKLMQFGRTTLPASLVEQIMERAQGNPFYIEELLNYLRDQGLDSRTLELGQLELPSSLQSLILSRIDQLSENQKTTLKIASVIGRLFQAAMLWGAYPQLGEPGLVRADLEKMSMLDLTPLDTPEPELTYLFRHVLTKEVAYESLPFATRALLHEQIGQYIERAHGASLDQYLDLLAYHFDHSHNTAKRREYLGRAAAAAQSAYANQAAIDYYDRLLPLLAEDERAPVVLKLAQVLELVGRWDEAGELYRQALGVAEQAGDQHALAQCYGALGNLLRRRGDYPIAADWLGRARAGFEELGDQAGVSQALEALGELYRMQGDYATARGAYEQSLELAEAIAPPQLGLARRAAALKGAGALAIHQGDYAAAHARYAESLTILRELGDQPVIASVLSNLGIVVQHEGHYARARALGEEALTLRRQLGDRWGTAVSLGNLGMVASLEGDYTRAIELYEECLALCRQLGEKNFSALTLNNLGDMRRAQGRYAEARALYQESLATQRDIGDRWAVAYLLESFAALAADEAQPERALRLAGAAAALRATIGAPLAPAEQLQLDRLLEPPRQTLGAANAAAEWQAGHRLAIDQAIDYALQEAY